MTRSLLLHKNCFQRRVLNSVAGTDCKNIFGRDITEHGLTVFDFFASEVIVDVDMFRALVKL
ncbi:hypothetical protein Plhal710r2_c003g0015951 [Plasmopara halstedii]